MLGHFQHLYSNLLALGRGKVAVNSAWILSDKIVRLFIGLFVGVLTARYLGPAQLGIWNYALSIFAFCQILAGLGLDQIIPKKLAENRADEAEQISQALGLRLIAAFLAMFLCVGFAAFLEGEINSKVYYVAAVALGFPFLATEIFEYYFQSKLQSAQAVKLKLFAYLLISVYKLALLVYHASLFWFVLSSTLEFFLSALFLSWYVWRKKVFTNHFASPNWSKYLDLIRQSWPFAISSLFAILLYRLDQIMLTQISGDSENGVYAVSMRLYELILVLPGAIAMSALPRLSELQSESLQHFQLNLQRYFALFTWFALPTVAIAWLLAPWGIEALYGAAFSQSGHVLQWLVVGLWAAAMNIALGTYFLLKNMWLANLMRTLIALVVNVVLNIILIPRYGAVGAACASSLALTAMVISSLFNKQSKAVAGLLIRSFDVREVIKRQQ